MISDISLMKALLFFIGVVSVGVLISIYIVFRIAGVKGIFGIIDPLAVIFVGIPLCIVYNVRYSHKKCLEAKKIFYPIVFIYTFIHMTLDDALHFPFFLLVCARYFSGKCLVGTSNENVQEDVEAVAKKISCRDESCESEENYTRKRIDWHMPKSRILYGFLVTFQGR